MPSEVSYTEKYQPGSSLCLVLSYLVSFVQTCLVELAQGFKQPTRKFRFLILISILSMAFQTPPHTIL